jgi:hypothetical protein
VIGGMLFDLLVVGAVLAFAWGATILGGVSALGRLVEATLAVGLAVLLRDPAGSVVESILGLSIEASRLVGMLLVGGGVWVATHRVYRWWRARREQERSPEGLDLVEPDRLDSRRVARTCGILIGIAWVTLFVAVLVLVPADTVVSRSAITSRTGGILIDSRDLLQWLRDGFPRYTQTLPKGTLGAVVGEQPSLVMHEPVSATDRITDVDPMLRAINDLRRSASVPVLTFNPDVAAVARRHAIALGEEQELSYSSPGGGTLDSRVLSALGETSGAFGEVIGIEVAWAHDPATAVRGLLDSGRATTLLRSPRWSEIGIGVADLGWFNGRTYVLLLVGPESVASGDPDEPGADDCRPRRPRVGRGHRSVRARRGVLRAGDHRPRRRRRARPAVGRPVARRV